MLSESRIKVLSARSFLAVELADPVAVKVRLLMISPRPAA